MGTTAESFTAPKQEIKKHPKHAAFSHCQPTKQAAERQQSLEVCCWRASFTGTCPKRLTPGVQRHFPVQNHCVQHFPAGTLQVKALQSYLLLWGTAASRSWRASSPGSETSPPPERRRSCYRWGSTCSCPPRCCLPACSPAHRTTERLRLEGTSGQHLAQPSCHKKER